MSISIRGSNSEKKLVTSVSAIFDFSDLDGTNAVKLVNIPRDLIITGVHLQVITAAQAGSTADIDLGTGANKVTLLNDQDITTAALLTSTTATLSETSNAIYMVPNQALTAGTFRITLSFIEFTKRTGEYVNY